MSAALVPHKAVNLMIDNAVTVNITRRVKTTKVAIAMQGQKILREKRGCHYSIAHRKACSVQSVVASGAREWLPLALTLYNPYCSMYQTLSLALSLETQHD